MRQVLLMIGTRKGGFLAFSDLARKRWEMTGPIFKGSQVNHVYCAGGAEPRVLAAGQSAWWGPGLQISMDWGQEWTEPIPRIQFADGREKSVERVWAVAGMGNTLYAGVDPAALFRSVDGGITWTELEALTDHPSHKKWMPGAGGMMVHSICVDPANAERVFVGISAAGVFCTEDGGKTWEPRNKNVRADFMPEDQFPEVGQCVHHLEMHPSNPEVLYQQNHCGVYRTEDGGREWIDIRGAARTVRVSNSGAPV